MRVIFAVLGIGGVILVLTSLGEHHISEDAFGFFVMAAMTTTTLVLASFREATLAAGMLVVCPIGLATAWYAFRGVGLALAIAGVLVATLAPNLYRRVAAT